MATRDTIARLDALSRQRPLTDVESRQLAQAINTLARMGRMKTGEWSWTEDDRLLAMRRAGRPYADISRELRRPPGECATRHRRLVTLAAGEARQAQYRAIADGQG